MRFSPRSQPDLEILASKNSPRFLPRAWRDLTIWAVKNSAKTSARLEVRCCRDSLRYQNLAGKKHFAEDLAILPRILPRYQNVSKISRCQHSFRHHKFHWEKLQNKHTKIWLDYVKTWDLLTDKTVTYSLEMLKHHQTFSAPLHI